MIKKISSQKGFTLTELIIVIVIVGIVSAIVSPLISNSFLAVIQSTQRANAVQQAEFALFHLRADLTKSVPYSVCTTTNTDCTAGQTIEFLGVNNHQRHVKARYRDKPLNNYDHLNINGDDSFDLLGNFNNLPSFVSIGVTSPAEARNSWQRAQTSKQASHITKIAFSNNRLTEQHSNSREAQNPTITNIKLANSNHNFLTHADQFQAYFSDGPVSYNCKNGTLYRVSNYDNLDPRIAYLTRTAQATVERVATNVSNCLFTIHSSNAFQPQTLEVQLNIGLGSEVITLVDIIPLGDGV